MWSPQLSIIYRNPDKPFQRAEFPDNPSETQYFYGLKSWFDGNKLKPEYLDKIKAKHKITEHATLFQ